MLYCSLPETSPVTCPVPVLLNDAPLMYVGSVLLSVRNALRNTPPHGLTVARCFIAQLTGTTVGIVPYGGCGLPM